MSTDALIRAFWDAMASNDFDAASQHLTEDFEGYWPQSRELITGRTAFAAVNTAYPAAGRWRFDVQQVVATGDRAVTDVAITDGQMHARAVTFHWVRAGRIAKQLEYWPDPYPAPDWRAPWVTHVDRPHFPD